MPQTYDHIGADGRVLQSSQTYNVTSTGGYLSIAAANASGLTASIRIVALWDVIKQGDWGSGSGPCTSQVASCPWQCKAASSTSYINVKGGTGFADCSKASTVVAEGNAIYNAMVTRTNAAIAFWQSAIRVKPVYGSITISAPCRPSTGPGTSNPCESGTIPNLVDGRSIPDADLVMIMQARRAWDGQSAERAEWSCQLTPPSLPSTMPRLLLLPARSLA